MELLQRWHTYSFSDTFLKETDSLPVSVQKLYFWRCLKLTHEKNQRSRKHILVFSSSSNPTVKISLVEEKGHVSSWGAGTLLHSWARVLLRPPCVWTGRVLLASQSVVSLSKIGAACPMRKPQEKVLVKYGLLDHSLSKLWAQTQICWITK